MGKTKRKLLLTIENIYIKCVYLFTKFKHGVLEQVSDYMVLNGIFKLTIIVLCTKAPFGPIPHMSVSYAISSIE